MRIAVTMSPASGRGGHSGEAPEGTRGGREVWSRTVYPPIHLKIPRDSKHKGIPFILGALCAEVRARYFLRSPSERRLSWRHTSLAVARAVFVGLAAAAAPAAPTRLAAQVLQGCPQLACGGCAPELCTSPKIARIRLQRGFGFTKVLQRNRTA